MQRVFQKQQNALRVRDGHELQNPEEDLIIKYRYNAVTVEVPGSVGENSKKQKHQQINQNSPVEII